MSRRTGRATTRLTPAHTPAVCDDATNGARGEAVFQMLRAWTWARVPFGPTRRRQDAVDVPLSTGRPGPSQAVSPRQLASRRLLPAAGWTWHPPDGAGARSVDPGQPENGVAPSYAERPCGGRRELNGCGRGPVNTRADLQRRGNPAGQRADRRS